MMLVKLLYKFKDLDTLAKEYKANKSDHHYEMIYLNLRVQIYTYLYRMVGNEEIATELAHDAFLKLPHIIHHYDEKRKFSSWFYRVSRNIAIDYIKKKGNQWHDEIDEEITESGENIEIDFIKTEKIRKVKDAINRLPANLKETLTLWLESIELKEIAEIQQVKLAVVKNNIHRAKLKIKENLKDEL